MTTRLSQHTLLLLISNVGGAALLFALSALIGRALGTDGLGIYAVALAWTYPLSLLVEFGLGTLMTRDLAQQPELTRGYLATVALARLMIGTAIMLLLFLVAPLLSDDAPVVAGIQVSAPMVVLVPFFSAFTAVFRAHGAMWPIPWLNIGMLAAQVALTAWVLVNGGTVLDVLVINVVTSIGQVLAAWGIYRRYFFEPQMALPTAKQSGGRKEDFVGDSAPLQWVKLREEVRRLIPLLRRAMPFALAALFAALQIRLSVILLERLTTTTEVGYFTAANRFTEAARLFPNALFGALFPALAALAANPQQLAATFRRAMRGLALFGVVASIGFTVSAQILMNLVYGADFAPAVPTLILLGWSLLFGVLRGGRTLYWYALERERYVNAVNAGVIVVQGALGLWLVPVYGAVGAAIGFLVVEAVALGLLWREVRFPIRTRIGLLNRKDAKVAKK